MFQDVNHIITNTIIEQLEKGVVPWHQPWKGDNSLLNGLPFNTSTGNRYRGINIVLLWAATLKHGFQSSEWGTFNHWKAAGEYIRKGEGARKAMIVKYGKREKEVDGELKEIPYLQKHWVFNRCQLQSWKPLENEPTVKLPINDAIVRSAVIDEFIANTGAIVLSHDGGACYRPADDKILLPFIEKFVDTPTCTAFEGFYSTALHELTHWTGATHRLNRTKGKKFGDQQYAFEELVAELGAAFHCAQFDISTLEKGDHAAYIDTWLKVLKENKQLLVAAAGDASKSFEYLQSLQPLPV